MRCYPEYRDSGVEWSGEIPSHWEIEKIKHIAAFVNEKSTPETDAIKISPEKFVQEKLDMIFNIGDICNTIFEKRKEGNFCMLEASDCCAHLVVA